MMPPTCTNIRVRTARDAEIIFHAVRLGILPMVHQRLGSEERMALCSGCVYVWEERSSSLSESMEQVLSVSPRVEAGDRLGTVVTHAVYVKYPADEM
ncbi:hypothetical protein EI94DRAFT_1131242 [Lactarius quietus]|nr:hypothetical protein EI94DRAFT_1131242 [Lactarius quietus]